MGFSHRNGRGGTAVLTERRTVYPSNEVPHLWAHGLPDDKEVRNAGGTIKAIGNTIYSYGTHFPMARRLEIAGDVVYLINPDRYSVTTSGHQSSVQQAIPSGARKYHIPPGPSRGSTNLWCALEEARSGPVVDYYLGRIMDSAKSAVKPRIRPETAKKHLDHIAHLVAEWQVVHSLFGLRCSVDQVTAPTDLEAVRDTVRREAESIKRAEARAAKALAARQAREAQEAAARQKKAERILPAWRRGGPSRTGMDTMIQDLGYPAFRIDPDDPTQLESSLGARVPLKAAERLWRMLPRLIPKDGERRVLEERIGVYGPIGVTKDTLEIGCHQIPLAEVASFAAFIGWL